LRNFVIHHSEGTGMMITLHKSLAIAFMAASIFISGKTVDFVGGQDTAAGTAASRCLRRDVMPHEV
jgi:hypothetical protein